MGGGVILITNFYINLLPTTNRAKLTKKPEINTAS